MEIGSEFWEVETDNLSKFTLDAPHNFFLTGRTALDYLIKEMKLYKVVKSVYMPSYCCHSMIQPFLDNGVDVEFYEVLFENGKYTYKIDFETTCDVIFIMQYFGYCNEKVSELIIKYKELGKIIIEDATHSWLSDVPYNQESDYVFASFRKWTGLPGGAVAIKQEGQFCIDGAKETNLEYIQLRKKAFFQKKQFIENGLGQKETFLEYFNQAEKLIEDSYQNYNIQQDIEDLISSLNFERIKEKRKQNSRYLIDGLKKFPKIETVSLEEGDVPLFVPIIVPYGRRNELHQYFINNDIYCPVHWPISDKHCLHNKFLYNNSMSIVCDQRYDLSDMKRILETLKKFVEDNLWQK
ncbi:hypothetical protein PB01_03845 [Psychrobacillus glaciei]|uniref:DegT/DnrJ/EryC1/StrS aminotransferase family protein n=1 Tax=Psychrobacillus glaciei TaxID=2283160 RepID=A0A5J6SJL9_9BACI|nr:hypothetical protein [Psychrobacillus glaciei]QFF98018.1 hypothetical protein PB01_03845 [Psychrobacillus glaciei]